MAIIPTGLVHLGSVKGIDEHPGVQITGDRKFGKNRHRNRSGTRSRQFDLLVVEANGIETVQFEHTEDITSAPERKGEHRSDTGFVCLAGKPRPDVIGGITGSVVAENIGSLSCKCINARTCHP